MNAIFKKLNYKNQHQIFIISAPNSFEKGHEGNGADDNY
jgi:hypothetical protein